METNVLLERVGENRYRATGASPFALSVEGTTRELAIENFQKAVAAILSPQSEIVTVQIPAEKPLISPDDPWAWFAGIAKNDPPHLRAMYLEQIETNRRMDEENVYRQLAEEEAEEEAERNRTESDDIK